MLDVRRMRVLKEGAAQGSFSAAAEALSFTQSAVSQQIAALERESGAKLVERRARGIRLTPAGQAVVSHADAILARLDDAEQELAAIAGLKGGRLRVASFQSAGATLVPRALAEFHRRHREVDLSASSAELTEARELLRSGEIDQMQACVAGGLGVALWPQLALAHVRPGVVVKPVAGHPVERRVHAATLAGAYRSAATEAMLAILRETAEDFTVPAPLRIASG